MHLTHRIASIELANLRAFVTVVDHGSVTAAARVLGYSQSAVSRQLQALEREVGASLLERSPAGIRMTGAGEGLLGHARRILADVDAAAEDLRTGRLAGPPRLRVGAVPSAAADLVPQALRSFAASPYDGAGRAEVVFEEDVTPALLAGLRAGTLDLAVVTDYPPGLPPLGDLEVDLLLDDEIVCVLPADHPRAATSTVNLADLAAEVWVEDYAGAASMLTAACARAGFVPRTEIRCGGWLSKQAFVAAGLGVMLAPGLIVPALRPDLAVRPLADPPHRRVFAVGSGSEAAHAFRHALVLCSSGLEPAE